MNSEFFTFVLSAFLIIGGLIGWRKAAMFARTVDDLLRTGTRAQAEVIGYKTTAARGVNTRCSNAIEIPIVRFNTPQGVVEPAILRDSNYPDTKVGEMRAVSYNPARPTEVVITDGIGGPAPTHSGLKLWYVAEVIGGVVILVVALRGGSIFPGGWPL